MERVQLEQLDARVEVSRGVGAVVLAALAGPSLQVVWRRHVRRDVKSWIGGCREVRLKLLLVQPLGWRVSEEESSSGSS